MGLIHPSEQAKLEQSKLFPPVDLFLLSPFPFLRSITFYWFSNSKSKQSIIDVYIIKEQRFKYCLDGNLLGLQYAAFEYHHNDYYLQLGLANKTFGGNNVFLEMFGVLSVAKTFLDPN